MNVYRRVISHTNSGQLYQFLFSKQNFSCHLHSLFQLTVRVTKLCIINVVWEMVAWEAWKIGFVYVKLLAG